MPRSPGVATTRRQFSGPAIRSTARLAYGADSSVSIPVASALPPMIASERCGPLDAVEQATMRLAEERSAALVGPDLDGRRLVDLDQRATGRRERPEIRVEGVGGGEDTARSSPPLAAVSGPTTSCLAALRGQAGHRQPPVERRPAVLEPAVGYRLEAGRLLRPDGGLDQLEIAGIGRQRRARQRPEQRGKHGGRAPRDSVARPS